MGATDPTGTIFRIKVSLVGVDKPPVWRRLQVPAVIRLDRLHDVVLEKVLAVEPGTRYPRCAGSKSMCPPEDCGGVWSYAELRITLADRSHERHAEILEWLGLRSGADFDPTAFDLDAVNAEL